MSMRACDACLRAWVGGWVRACVHTCLRVRGGVLWQDRVCKLAVLQGSHRAKNYTGHNYIVVAYVVMASI